MEWSVGERGQKVRTSSYKIMYNEVTIINNTVTAYLKVAEVLITRKEKEFLTKCGDGGG